VRIWVIDTSAILAMRRLVSAPILVDIFADLDFWVHRGALTYPSQVLGELERHTEAIKKRQRGSDPPYAWVKKNESKAARHGPMYEGARTVLERVPNLVDPAKVSIGGVDVADPYVIALALTILADHDVPTIITEDFVTTPLKTGLADAAGLFLIPTVRARTFLRDEEIWPPPGEPG
jgi:hypothetical protein